MSNPPPHNGHAKTILIKSGSHFICFDTRLQKARCGEYSSGIRIPITLIFFNFKPHFLIIYALQILKVVVTHTCLDTELQLCSTTIAGPMTSEARRQLQVGHSGICEVSLCLPNLFTLHPLRPCCSCRPPRKTCYHAADSAVADCQARIASKH